MAAVPFVAGAERREWVKRDAWGAPPFRGMAYRRIATGRRATFGGDARLQGPRLPVRRTGLPIYAYTGQIRVL
jgi:hypothetical protein